MDLELISQKLYKTMCMGIEMYHKILDEGQAGDNVGILLKNIPNKEISRGDVLAIPNSVTKRQKFRATVNILLETEGGRTTGFISGYCPQFFFRVNNVSGRIILDENAKRVVYNTNDQTYR